jgi:hypothetical protein
MLVSDVRDPLWYFLVYCTKVILKKKKSSLAEANGLAGHLFHGNNMEVMMV